MPTQQTKTIGIPACIMMKSVWTYYTLYCVYMITSRRTRAAAAETDGVGEQQLKQMESGSSSLSGCNRVQFGLTTQD